MIRSNFHPFSLINFFLSFFGASLHKLENKISFKLSLKRLDKLGFRPNQVFDIGVGYGSPDIYSHYKYSTFYLYDPIPNFKSLMKFLPSPKSESFFFEFALSDKQSNYFLNKNIVDIGTSFISSNKLIDSILIETKRFDTLPEAKDLYNKRNLLKIDVQGHELEVLKGFGKYISHIDVVIVEVQSLITVSSEPTFLNVCEYLINNEFVLIDLSGIGRRPLDNFIAELDLVFININKLNIDLNKWV